MKYISYVYNGINNYGILSSDKTQIVPMKELLNSLAKDLPENLLGFIQKYSNSLTADLAGLLIKHEFETIPLNEVKITAPIPYPRRNIFCLGKNYADHAVEIKNLPGGKAEIPTEPIYFTKVADPAIGTKD